jgi:uncharacterized protein
LKEKTYKYIKPLFIDILILLGITMLMCFAYLSSSIKVYSIVILFFIVVCSFFTVFLTMSMLILYIAYKNEGIKRCLVKPMSKVLRIVMPFVLHTNRIFKFDLEALRKFFICVNNIIIKSGNKKFEADKILIILPHCLQNNDCNVKVTNNNKNCLSCGKCIIGELNEISKITGINLSIVTGGTAARNQIILLKPEFIISVACERDLISGLIDVDIIPVIGIVNIRPEGPCFNTSVDINKLIDSIISILDTEDTEVIKKLRIIKKI